MSGGPSRTRCESGCLGAMRPQDGDRECCRGIKKKKRSAEPRPLPRPLRQGTNEQHPAGAPFAGRSSKHCFVGQEPFGSGWSFSRKQKLDARASFNCLSRPSWGHRRHSFTSPSFLSHSFASITTREYEPHYAENAAYVNDLVHKSPGFYGGRGGSQHELPAARGAMAFVADCAPEW